MSKRIQKTHRPWDQAELDRLRSAYSAEVGDRLELAQLSAALGRSRANVCRKARELGLTRPNRPKKTQRMLNLYGPKFGTESERLAASSASAKRRISERGHPRGFAGKTHSAESRAVIGAKSREAAQRQTPEERASRGEMAARTRLLRYGTGNPTRGENAYSRAKRGKRDDLGGQFFRSAWEANYARYLNWLVAYGAVTTWEYEPETFVFHGVTRGVLTYTPDFRVVWRWGSSEFHEVKGWMDPKSKAKLKRMSKFYPHHAVRVVGASEYRAIAKWARLIPGWES